MSNASFDIALVDESLPASTGRDRIRFAEISDTECRRIRAAITADGAAAHIGTAEACLELRTTPLGVSGHETHVRGLVDEFFEKHFPDVSVRVSAAHRVLTDEVRRKSQIEDPGRTFMEQVSRKGISAPQFTRLIQTIVSESRAGVDWRDVGNILQAEGLSFHRIRALRQIFVGQAIRLADPDEHQMRDLHKWAVRACPEELGDDSLPSFLDKATALGRRLDVTSIQLSEDERLALAARAVYEIYQSANSSSQPPEEAR